MGTLAEVKEAAFRGDIFSEDRFRRSYGGHLIVANDDLRVWSITVRFTRVQNRLKKLFVYGEGFAWEQSINARHGALPSTS